MTMLGQLGDALAESNKERDILKTRAAFLATKVAEYEAENNLLRELINQERKQHTEDLRLARQIGFNDGFEAGGYLEDIP